MDLPNLCLLLAHLISFIIIFKFIKAQLSRHNNLPTPPSPPSLPFLGHLHHFNLTKGSLHLNLQELAAKYGPTLYLRLGTHRLLLLSSADTVEQCFTQNDVVFANRPEIISYQLTSYNYTIVGAAPYGELWRNLRRFTVLNIFSAASVRRSATVRNAQVHQMIRSLNAKPTRPGNITKVNLNTLLSNLSLSVAGLTTLGKTSEEIGNTFQQSGLFSICDFVPVLRWIGYTGFEKTLKKSHAKRDTFLQSLIDEFRHKNNGSSQEIKTDSANNTLLETLMSMQAKDPETYSDDIIKGLLMLVFTAGVDTSVKTMEWAMTLLLNHPDILAKARKEIDTFIGSGHLINDSDVSNLPYLRCIINETLRLFPVAPLLIPHWSSTDCIVNGYYVPKNTILIVNAWAVQRDGALWDEPNEFKPERFEGFEGERDGYKFIPFGVGRRSCPGVALGMRFMALGLGALIQCFEWERVESGAEDLSQGTGSIAMPKGKPLVAKYAVRDSMSSLLSKLEM